MENEKIEEIHELGGQKMREFAIICTEGNDFSKNILSKLPVESKKTVFMKKNVDFDCDKNTEVVLIPEEIQKSNSKVKNFVARYYFDRNFKNFLHIIEDGVEILKDPSEFLDKIEEMMIKLDQKTWFNTETDPCNYTFTQFNPRMSVIIDEPEAKKVYDKTIYWTSHANTSWVIISPYTALIQDVLFNEDFTIAMFYIIQFLAERRNNKKPGELYYMNFYPTIEEERGVFRLIENDKKHQKDKEEVEKDQKTMSEENKIFENLKINHAPDSSVEQVIEDIYNILTK